MKKSKLLQSSKEMLSRSFNPTKCKTSLKLTSSRLKLLKNKKQVQVKQMKREIAQLLESGQDQTARMRVEHVIREEKMMAAYDLLEIYCELIVARLPIIESQKGCPIDLKEAIASVIFASLRCGDVPELLDVRKQLTAKYGKDFTTAAIELRPQSGVGRMLVEKLSATAPDVQMKVKILSAIAEEHNVKWDHESLEETDPIPSNDSLIGASTYGKESKPHVEQPRFEAADSQDHQNTIKMRPASSNGLQQDPGTSVEAEKFPSNQPSVVSTIYQPEARPQVDDHRAQLFQGDSNTSSPGRQRWNMEFKDATSAAQAAAESAELASMAAKAAAELSMRNRVTRQDSTEVHGSDVNIKDGRPEIDSSPKFSQEQFPIESVKRSSPAPTESHNEQIGRINAKDPKRASRFKEDYHGGPEEYDQSGSLKSKPSRIDNTVDYSVPVVDEYSQRQPSEKVSTVETSMQKQPFKHEGETVNDWVEKAKNQLEKKVEQQHCTSPSHSSISDDDVNIFANSEDPKYENADGENAFVNIAEGGIHEGEAAHPMHSYEDAAVVYDRLDSDTDDHGFHLGPKYDTHYSGFNLSSLSHKSAEHQPVNTDSWSPRSSSAKAVDVDSTTPPLFSTRENSSPDFSENITSRDDAEVDNFAPVTYDDSDGTSSDVEDMNAGHYEVEDSRRNLGKIDERGQASTLQFENRSQQSVGSPLVESVVNRKQLSISSDDELMPEELDHRKQLSISSEDELRSEELDHSRTGVKRFYAGSSGMSGLQKHIAEQPALGPKESRKELSDSENETYSGSETGLNFGKLTGGLRNKGGNTLPSLKNRLNVSSTVKDETEKTIEATRTSSAPHAVEPPKNTLLYNKKSTPDLHSESDSDSSEDEEILQRNSARKPETYARTEVKTKLSLGASNSILDSDSSDSDEVPSKESLSRKSHLLSGVSRRTRASPSGSGNNSYSRMHLRSEANDTDAGFDREPKTSNNSDTQKKIESQRRNSVKWEDSNRHNSAKVASNPGKSIFWKPPEQHDYVKTSIPTQESKAGLRSEVHDARPSLGEKSSNSSSPNTQQKVQSLNRKSSQLDISEQPMSPKMASRPTGSSLLGTSVKPNLGKGTSTTMQKSNISQRSSTAEEPSKPLQKPETSISSEVPKSETSSKISSNEYDSPKRASHVHPKLPDYDMLLQSLGKNRS